MNGRVYDPDSGRFLSADPNIFHPFETQDFNRYAYVMNNPLKYTDPSGFDFFGSDDDGSTWGDWDNDFDANGDWNGFDGDEKENDDGSTTQRMRDDNNEITGNVTYDQKRNYDVSYNNGTVHGYQDGLSYSFNAVNKSYSVTNYNTKEYFAGGIVDGKKWDYHQKPNFYEFNQEDYHVHGNMHGYQYENTQLGELRTNPYVEDIDYVSKKI